MKPMIRGVALACLLAASTAHAGRLPANAALEREIRALDQAHAKAILGGDSAALQDLMEDDVTVNHPTNRIVNEKRELLELIDSGVICVSGHPRYRFSPTRRRAIR